MKCVVSGIKYEYGRNPALIFDSPQSNDSRSFFVLEQDRPFTLKRMRSRYCSGWYDLARHESYPCLTQERVELKEAQCKSCREKTGYNPWFDRVSPDELSSMQIKYNNEPHIVYLASFGPNLLKVGISNKKRIRQRWLDQGAIYAIEVIHVNNAYEARKIEKSISESLSIPESVSQKEKLSSLVRHGINYSDGIDLIKYAHKCAIHVGTTLGSDNIFTLGKVADLLRIEFRSVKDIGNCKPLILSGRVLGSIGNLMFFKNQGNTYFCDIKEVRNHLCDFYEEETPISDGLLI